MKKLSRQKINQLIQVGVGIAVAMAALWWTLIRYQLHTLDDLKARKEKAETDGKRVSDTVNQSKQLEAELAVVSKKLEEEEQDMATGDINSWMYSFIRKFKNSYRVDVPQLGSGEIGAVKVLPDFPYTQVSVGIGGTAYYHDLGRFIADFENQFPYARMSNLELTPAPAQTPGRAGKTRVPDRHRDAGETGRAALKTT